MASSGAIRAGQAFVELLTDSSKLEKGLRAAGAKLKAWGASISGLGRKLLGVGSAIAAPMVGAAVSFSNSGDALAKMAARTGISVEALSQLAYAAGQSGVATEALESGIRRMQRTLYDAARGGSREAREAFESIGLSLDEINGLPVAEKLKAIADRMAAIESPTKRAAVAQMIFGRGGTAMLPLLSQGAAGMNKLMAEADRLGITMSTADAAGAVEFHDSMSTLWAVLKRVRDHLAAALVPTLMAAARWLTDVAGKTGAWLRANQGLLLTVFQVAVGIAAAGVAFMVLGKAVALAGTMFTVFAVAAKVVIGTLLIIKGAILALVSPIGLVIAAVAALGGYCLYSTGQIDKATGWLAEGFDILKNDALTAFGGISDALAAGNIQLAAQVLWAYLKLLWQQGTGWLSVTWTKGMNWLTKVFTEAWSSLRIVFNAVVYGLASAWDWLTTGIWRAASWIWDKLVQGWTHVTSAISSAWNWLMEKVGQRSEEEAAAEYKRIEDEKNARINAVQAEGEAWRAEQERQREGRQKARDQEFTETVSRIVTEQTDRERALDADLAAKEKANQADVDAARKRLADLSNQAKEERKAKERPGPDGLKSPEEVVGKLKSALAGIGDELDIVNKGQSKEAAKGTFNAAALLGLQAGGPQERIANATEKTARNTDKLLNRANTGALTFV